MLGAFNVLGRPVHHMIGNHWCGNSLTIRWISARVSEPEICHLRLTLFGM